MTTTPGTMWTRCMLEGAELDAAVAMVQGRLVVADEPGWAKGDLERLRKEYGGQHVVRWYATENGEPDGKITGLGGWEPLGNQGSPSTDWAVGGPIIEENQIFLQPPHGASYISGGPGAGHYWRDQWSATVSARVRTYPNPIDATHSEWLGRGIGPTPLIAAMRAFVASFGDMA